LVAQFGTCDKLKIVAANASPAIGSLQLANCPLSACHCQHFTERKKTRLTKNFGRFFGYLAHVVDLLDVPKLPPQKKKLEIPLKTISCGLSIFKLRSVY